MTRACDECRKKKVKCDGQQPCVHCTTYSYVCTYNQPTKRALTSPVGLNLSKAGIDSGSVSKNKSKSKAKSKTKNDKKRNDTTAKNDKSVSVITEGMKPADLISITQNPPITAASPNYNEMNPSFADNDSIQATTFPLDSSQLNTLSNELSNEQKPIVNPTSPTVIPKQQATGSNTNSKSNSNSNSSNSIPPTTLLKDSKTALSTSSTPRSAPATTRRFPSKNLKLQGRLEKYRQLLQGMIPSLPDIELLDVPTFLRIFYNFKGNSTLFDDVIREYNLIAPQMVSSPRSLSYNFTDNLPISTRRNMSQSYVMNLDSTMNKSLETESNFLPYQTIERDIKIILPPKNVALRFVKIAWDYCCVLLRFYHRPSFLEQFNELYSTDPSNYTEKMKGFLALCYSTIAIGALFSKSVLQNEDGSPKPGENVQLIKPVTDGAIPTALPENMNLLQTSKSPLGVKEELPYSSPNNSYFSTPETVDDEREETFLHDEGYRYFMAARKLIDITDTRDLVSIETVLMLFIYLQCSARLSTCYTYLAVAMRSALREGLHRASPPDAHLDPIETETRKRLFYTIYKLDIYVNTMLGLPRSLLPEDFDQTLPVELSDVNITADGYYPERQNNVLSSVAISNFHTKLTMIIGEIVKELYPIKKSSNIISHETVSKLEMKLENWVAQLPPELQPYQTNIPYRYERANKLLHLALLHAQIILYRPFIHFLSRSFSSVAPDPLSLQCAKNSITVARNAVRLGKQMIEKKLLTGSYWFSSYTIFYAVSTLFFYMHEANLPDKASAKEYYEVLTDAEDGRNLLNHVRTSSVAASRIYDVLNKLFEKLNAKTFQMISPWRIHSVDPADVRVPHPVIAPGVPSHISTVIQAPSPATSRDGLELETGVDPVGKTPDIKPDYNLDNFMSEIEMVPPPMATGSIYDKTCVPENGSIPDIGASQMTAAAIEGLHDLDPVFNGKLAGTADNVHGFQTG